MDNFDKDPQQVMFREIDEILSSALKVQDSWVSQLMQLRVSSILLGENPEAFTKAVKLEMLREMGIVVHKLIKSINNGEYDTL
jgi:hypothetical protein